jgi:urea transporter
MRHFGKCTISSFGLYVLGFAVLLTGVGYAAFLLHVPHTWIIVGVLVIIDVGIMSAVTRTERRDPPSEAPPVA